MFINNKERFFSKYQGRIETINPFFEIELLRKFGNYMRKKKLKWAAPRFELVKDQLRLTHNKFFQVSREEISYPFPTSNRLF